MEFKISNLIKAGTYTAALLCLCACNTMSNAANPYYETPPPEALLGERNDHALSGTREKIDTARQALDAAATYQRAHMPQPYNPVMQPAVVRLMWVPDRLNKTGDLVPAHYYYLKVLDERWAVTDAFELEAQLNGPRGSMGNTSNIPYVNADDKVR